MAKTRKNKLSPHQRRLAAIDLTQYYLASVWVDWRLVQVMSIQKRMEAKYSFYAPIMETLYDTSNERVIAQSVTNGLLFDAIAHCIQYVEDIFALIRASRNPDYFIRDIITYQAGQITSLIKSFKPTEKNMADAFHYPLDLIYAREEDQVAYQNDSFLLKQLVMDLLQFYKDYEFFYVQYKHGLTIPLKPFARDFTDKQVAESKAGTLTPLFAVYDNFNIQAARERRT